MKNRVYELGVGPNGNMQDVIDAAFHNGEGESFCRWLAVKYIVRAGKKIDGTLTQEESLVKDLGKAIDVLQRWKEEAQRGFSYVTGECPDNRDDSNAILNSLSNVPTVHEN
jgi:hypothetical protein